MAYDPLSIEPGELRHKITIQAPSSTDDQFGQPVQTWVTVLVTYAKIQTVSMRDVAQAGQGFSQVTHIVTIRYPGSAVTLKPGNRVIFGGQRFNIQAIDNVLLRNRVLRLQCMVIDEAAA